MLNQGYQNSDARIVDYDLWGLYDEVLRGPQPDLRRPFFTALGAAQTFGRFVDVPFPELLSRRLGLQALNMGVSGAGPSYFLERPNFIEIINSGEFAIVQVLSARSTSNEIIAVGKNQGESIIRGDPTPEPIFAEVAYKRLVAILPAEKLGILRTQCRLNYIVEMKELIRAIRVPVVLLYFSRRSPNYAENLNDIGGYWGDFPHFVTQQVVDELLPHITAYVNVESGTGLPQPLFDKVTGEPIEIWPEDSFPNVRYRTSNNYYPSPEMHNEVARVVEKAWRSETRKAPVAPLKKGRSWRAKILCHARLGEDVNFESTLRYAFSERWVDLDHESPPRSLQDYISREDLPQSSAVSARLDLSNINHATDVSITSVVYLTHPIIRVKAIFDCLRDGSALGCSQYSNLKRLDEESFGDWCERVANSPHAFLLSDFQARTIVSNSDGDTTAKDKVHISELNAVLEILRDCEVGTTETYARSLIRIEGNLKKTFPGLTLLDFSGRKGVIAIDESCKAIADIVRPKTYRMLCMMNEIDLYLHNQYLGR